MSDYPTLEEQADPNFVWPLRYAAPQDRGESAPAANPAPGPGNPTEPDVENKEFVDTSPDLADVYDHEDSAEFTGRNVNTVKGTKVDAPASRGGGVEVKGVGKGK
jgi:hypothetical protein